MAAVEAELALEVEWIQEEHNSQKAARPCTHIPERTKWAGAAEEAENSRDDLEADCSSCMTSLKEVMEGKGAGARGRNDCY